MTPESTANYSATSFSSTDDAATVQTAIETLTNVDAVDVEKNTLSGGDTEFLVTFLSNLGEVPAMTSSDPTDIPVDTVTEGVCEVQTITVSADIDFTREEQQFTIATTTTSLVMEWYSSSSAVASEISISGSGTGSAVIASDIESALELETAANGSPLEVTVTSIDDTSNSDTTFKIVFTNPVGDIPTLVVTTPTSTEVVESVKGVTPVTGSFTVFFEGQYTDDIAMDASAADMKSALESLSTIGNLRVSRDDTNNGFKWTVSFVQNVGNLRMMEASPYRY
jgi:hypothetical protein